MTLDLLKFEDPREGDDGIQTLDYRATLHAAADAIEKGITAHDAAQFLVDSLDEEDLDRVDEAARSLGLLAPLGSLSQLCVALDDIDAGPRSYHPGYDPEGVEDLLSRFHQLRSMRKRVAVEIEIMISTMRDHSISVTNMLAIIQGGGLKS